MKQCNRQPLKQEMPSSPYGWDSGNRLSAFAYLGNTTLQLIRDLGANSVLDIGSGNGDLVGALHPLLREVFGLEPDLAGVELARARHPNCNFMRGGVDDAPGAMEAFEAHFECVTAIEVIEHLFDPTLLIDLAHRSLRPSGHLVLSTPFHGYVKNLAISLVGGWDAHHHPLDVGGHIKFWSRSSMEQLLINGGFRPVRFIGVGRVPLLWKSMFIVAEKN